MTRGGTVGMGGMLIRPSLSPFPAWLTPRRPRVEIDRLALDWDNPDLPALIAAGDRSLRQTSASALKTLDRCATAFWLGDVVGIKTQSGVAAAAGTAIHDGHETWRKTGTPLPHPSVVLASLRGHLPPLRDAAGWGLEVEFWSPIQTGAHNITIHGFIDLLWVSADGRRAKVRDLKTKSSGNAIGKYALTARAMAKDLQARIYAWAVFQFCPNVETVEVGHVYLSRDEPHSAVVTATLTRHVHEVTLLGELMTETDRVVTLLRQHPSMASVPRNPSACWDYGGCDFLRVCHPDEDDAGVPQNTGENDDGFLGQDVVAALRASLGAPVPSPLSALPFPGINPPDGYPPGVQPPPSPTKKERAMDFMQAINAAAGAAAQPPAAPTGAPPAQPSAAPSAPAQLWSVSAGAPVQAQGAHPGFSNPNPAHLVVDTAPLPAQATPQWSPPPVQAPPAQAAAPQWAPPPVPVQAAAPQWAPPPPPPAAPAHPTPAEAVAAYAGRLHPDTYAGRPDHPPVPVSAAVPAAIMPTPSYVSHAADDTVVVLTGESARSFLALFRARRA